MLYRIPAHVSTNRCRNSSSVSRIGTRYTRSCIMPQMRQSTGFRSGLLAGHMSGLMNCGVSRRRSSTVSRARCAGAQTRLQQCCILLVAAPATRLNSTAVDYCSKFYRNMVGIAQFRYRDRDHNGLAERGTRA